jgi:DNA polymerase-3 subunit gamma/tau
MLGIIDPQTLNNLIKAITNKNKEKVIEFINAFSTYEAEMILDELTLYIQDKLLSNDAELSTLTIDRFFRILADGKKLLSFGSSGEFVLSLSLFKMIEAMNIHSIDDMIHKLQNELNTPSTTIKEDHIPQNQTQKKHLQEPKPITPKEQIANSANSKFKLLIEKIYDRNYNLGKIFEENITFINYENNTLTWESTVEGKDKKLLIENWAILRHFVEEIFGLDTKIENISKKKLKPKEDSLNKIEKNEEILPPQKNSCIMPNGNSEASIDKDPKELLNEPMIKEFIKLLDPKKVTVKQKS